LLILGWLYIAIGLRVGKLVLAKQLGAGAFEGTRLIRTFAAVGVALVGWGLITILERRRKFLGTVNSLLATLLVVCPLLGELFFRTGIAFNISGFRNPGLYADAYADDDHWELAHRWYSYHRLKGQASQMVFIPPGLQYSPTLGWAPKASPDNPLGILAKTPYQPDYVGPAILFYGDSFVYGHTSLEEKIPQQLGGLLPGCAVYNYGVYGYGVDQIFLRLEESFTRFRKPRVIFGILTTDIDRSVLTLRDAPKPYFAVSNGVLELRGVPVPPRPSEWLRQNPPPVRSYLLAFLKRVFTLSRIGWNSIETTAKQAEKELVSSQIFDTLVRQSRQFQFPLLFVIFYSPDELWYTGWRERYLHVELQRLGVPYLDTKLALVNAIKGHGEGISAFYLSDGHPTPLGNAVIAQAIAEYVLTQANGICPELGHVAQSPVLPR